MKIFNFLRLSKLVFIPLALLLLACHQDTPLPLAAYLGGRYKWVKTTTPSKTITPTMVGYQEDLTLSSDSKGQYLAYYRNDNLFLEADVKATPVESDGETNSLLYDLGEKGFIKVYLSVNANNAVTSISTSTIVENYSPEADTVRAYYELTGLDPRKR